MINILETDNSTVLQQLMQYLPHARHIEDIARKHQREHSVYAIDNMTQRWYDSLEGHPDYSVYDDDEYIAELWACWANYSRVHLKNIQKSTNLPSGSIVQDLGAARNVVDLGCGFGLTTTALQQLFPTATVWGTNLDNTVQIEVARTLAQQHGCHIVTDIANIQQPVDLIFASEYFEHWINHIEHLDQVIEQLNPGALLIANAFNTRAIGHFERYTHHGQSVPQENMSKLFNRRLREHGYVTIKTKLWNNRPRYWKRESQ